MKQQESCQEWVIANAHLEVTFSLKGNVLSVQDKRIGKVWKQTPLGEQINVSNVTKSGTVLIIDMLQDVPMTATLELTPESELHITIAAHAETKLEKLEFPGAFKAPDAQHYLLQTDSQGLLLPVADTFYPLEEQPFFYAGGGPAMAWVGVTDHALESGYMAIFETPYDAAVRFTRVEGFITFYPVWLSSMGQFSYTRRIRYVFFDRGGYVAQCKRYRAYIWPKNNVVSLRENQERFPAIGKLLGAVHIYVWDKAREIEFARRMKRAGIDKALVLWDANHIPYPEPDYDNALKALGYGSGAYELFNDIHPDEHPANAEVKDIPLKRNVYPGLFDKLTSKRADGSHYSNEFGTYVCPEAVRPEIIKRADKEMSLYPHETYFVDVCQANGLYECYDPEHPLTRQQYAEAMLRNYELLKERYNVYIGAEFGADFAGSSSVYVHGMMTLQRTWFACADTTTPGSIYYKGDWEDNPRPSIMLGARTAHADYLKYALNEYTRVPLYELVYHDAVVTSWRWEDCNHHSPEIWWKKDLFNILYGTAPLWSIDQDRWNSFETTFVQSYHKVCGWLQEICYDELVEHRFITADRKVQESRFSSGRRVVVNFGDEPYVFEEQLIPSRNFKKFKC